MHTIFHLFILEVWLEGRHTINPDRIWLRDHSGQQHTEGMASGHLPINTSPVKHVDPIYCMEISMF